MTASLPGGKKINTRSMDFTPLHPWKVSLEQAIRIQNDLRQRLESGIRVPRLKTVAGADVEYREGKAYGAVAVLSVPRMKLVEQACACCEINFPYLPGFLSFREGPVLLECFCRLSRKPDVVIFDGQGIAHPRGFGIAAHLGLLLDCPTVGCAKSKLFGHVEEPGLSRGSQARLLDDSGQTIGAALRTREKVRPVYVSPGFKMDLTGSLKIVLACATKYRIPEPLRKAHQLARQTALEGN